ncbi:exonuclease/endonuclease/phosphatase family protein [Ferruginibacter profundus]
MTIITWNCNMAFRKKAAVILQHQPDIVVVQECEHPDKLKFTDDSIKPKSILWIGENKNKGLGIFSYSDFKLKLHKSYNPDLKLIAPVSISNGQTKFMLYAIWANNPGDKDGQYVTQVWKALKHYNKLIRKKNTILAGDFNSNTIWDKPRREGNHSTVVQHLAAKNIYSVYHTYFLQEQGKESHPTHYLYRHQNKPYHLDYCFVSGNMLNNLQSVEVGDYKFWKQYSDHVPVIIHFSEPEN